MPVSRPFLRRRRGVSALALLIGLLAANSALALADGFDADRRSVQAAPSWRLAQADDGHSAHHPGASGAGADGTMQPNGSGSPDSGPTPSAPSSGDAAGMMSGMGEMMGRPRKAFYPSLMDMPALSAEQRRNLESQARGWINGDIDRISESEMDLRHALAAGDASGADRASVRLRESLNAVQSGVAVLRALDQGQSPRETAQSWFRTQMNLSPRAAVVGADGVLGISWFHVTTMVLLAIFSSGMLAVHMARMRRANALVDRLMRTPAVVSPTSAPVIEMAGTGGGSDARMTPSPAGQTAEPRASGPNLDRAPARAAGPWKGRLRVCAIYPETPNVKTFRLQAADGGAIPFSFLPGQFLTYAIEIDGQLVRRSYTIASSAAQTAYVETTIKHEDDGLLSDYMHRHVKEGDLLDVLAPSGAFTFTGVEADSVVLVGGGVGITPLMAAIRYLSDIAWPGQIYLVYGAQSTQQFIFRDELEYLQTRMNNLHVAATMARASGTSWMGSEGQITPEFLTRAVPDLAKRRVHLCGPPGMMEALKTTLRELGVPAEQIRTEAFGPARGAVPPPARRAAEAEAATGGSNSQGAPAIGPATATIRFATSGKVAALPPDRSVLEVAESNGVPIDYSCRVGVCGVCKTHLVEGQVTMEVQDALTEDDRAKGIILACQAKSVGNLVVEA